MPRVAALSRILGSIEGEIRAATSCDAVGFVVPSTGGMLRFEARNQLMASAAYVKIDDVPDTLRLPIEAPRRLTPIPSLRAESPSERFLSVFELTSMCVVPLDVDGGGLMWIANRTQAPIPDEDVRRLERAAILSDGGLITAEHLNLDMARTPPVVAASSAPERAASALSPVRDATPTTPTSDLASMEKAMVIQALEKHRYNKSKAATELGLTRAQLYVRMKRHGLE
jgi:hypothetical protein